MLFSAHLGSTFNRLTIEEIVEVRRTPGGSYIQVVRCSCVCGGERICNLNAVQQGKVKGCKTCSGRVLSKYPVEHPLRTVYWNMRDRCENPNTKTYKYYGGRGIYVCDRWCVPIKGFDDFVDDMGPRPPGVYPNGRSLWSVERQDNDGPYSPDNCVWATQTQQNANRRKIVKTKGWLRRPVRS